MAYRNLEIGNRGAVRTITVNRPDKLNALNRDTLNELTIAFAQAAQDDAVRSGTDRRWRKSLRCRCRYRRDEWLYARYRRRAFRAPASA
jgi:Enoyl-CoA hydratase/carnithine racemase